jgi:hypothetical protein
MTNYYHNGEKAMNDRERFLAIIKGESNDDLTYSPLPKWVRGLFLLHLFFLRLLHYNFGRILCYLQKKDC